MTTWQVIRFSELRVLPVSVELGSTWISWCHRLEAGGNWTLVLQPTFCSALPTYALCLVSSSESNEVWKRPRMSLFSVEGACAPSLSLGICLPYLPVYLQSPTQWPLLRTSITLNFYHVSSLLLCKRSSNAGQCQPITEPADVPASGLCPSGQCCPCYLQIAQYVSAASQEVQISWPNYKMIHITSDHPGIHHGSWWMSFHLSPWRTPHGVTWIWPEKSIRSHTMLWDQRSFLTTLLHPSLGCKVARCTQQYLLGNCFFPWACQSRWVLYIPLNEGLLAGMCFSHLITSDIKV